MHTVAAFVDIWHKQHNKTTTKLQTNYNITTTKLQRNYKDIVVVLL